MIKVKPRPSAWGEEAVRRLEQESNKRSPTAKRVHQCSTDLIDAIQCLDGNNWSVYFDFDSGVVSFSRDWS